MKMQNIVIFAKKKLKINKLQVKKHYKFRDLIHYAGEY